MKTPLLTLALGLTLPLLGHAKGTQIKIEQMGYPAPATLHFQAATNALAGEAVKACGGTQKVGSLSNIIVEFKNGLPDLDVGSLTEGETFPYEFTLLYPRLLASATVNCLD